MTTSDERRKAAALMRNESADFRRLGEEYCDAWTVDLADVPATFQDIAHYVGLDGVVRNDTLFDRIADLIDPTCHNASPQALGVFECSECGAQTWYQSIETRPNYCSYCGARCVDDD